MKLIGSDYDGTLNHGGIDDKKREAIHRWRAAGNKFGVVSGRGLDFLAELTAQLGEDLDFYVSCNGGIAVTGEGQCLFDIRCTDVSARQFVGDLLRWGAPMVYINYEDACIRVGVAGEVDYLIGDMPEPTYFHKMAVFLPGFDEAAALAARIREAYDGLVNPLLNGQCVDIGPAGVDKAAGLRGVAAHYGIPEKDIIAVGDNLNDLAMIESFTSYAMSHGNEQLKQTATHTIDSVTDLIDRELADRHAKIN